MARSRFHVGSVSSKLPTQSATVRFVRLIRICDYPTRDSPMANCPMVDCLIVDCLIAGYPTATVLWQKVL